MIQSLNNGQIITANSGHQIKIVRLIGSGGQGEVYEAVIGNTSYALKWYFPEQATDEQYKIIEDLVRRGAPNSKFLWPLDIVKESNGQAFGYIMPLRNPQLRGIVDMMKRRAEPSFEALCTAAYQLADSYHELHARGLCYRDISFGNVFFNPNNGEVSICDNDNVAVTGSTPGGVLGTPRFMAPEIVQGEAQPSTQTDLFSLSVLLFYMLMLHHPLEGRKESNIHCLDVPAMNRLYGEEALFIWDSQDDSNRPVQGYHDNAIVFWGIYPDFIKNLFQRAFTDGIKNPMNGRVREPEWRNAFIQLRDSIIYCVCGAENFYDIIKTRNGVQHTCWSCSKAISLPPRIKIGTNLVMLNAKTKLYAHHLGDSYNFDVPVAEITQHPQNPNIWGLRNLSTEKWIATRPDGSSIEVLPQKSVSLGQGTKIYFGNMEGEIRQ